MAVRWARVGDANDVVAMTAVNDRIFAATPDSKLWWRDPVATEAIWSHIGHANNVIALTAIYGKIYAVTKLGELWSRDPVGANVAWTEAGYAEDAIAIAAAGGKLVTISKDGKLRSRSPMDIGISWEEIGNADAVTLTAIDGRLIAATGMNRLRWRYPALGVLWQDIGDAPYVVAMAEYQGKLFAATRYNEFLWTPSDQNLWTADDSKSSIIDLASAASQLEPTLVRLKFDNAGIPLPIVLGAPTSNIQQPVPVVIESTSGRVAVGSTPVFPNSQTIHSIFVSPTLPAEIWLRALSVGRPDLPGDILRASSLYGESELEVWIEPARGDWLPHAGDSRLDAKIVAFHAALMPKHAASEMLLFSPARTFAPDGQPAHDEQGHEIWNLGELHNVEIRAMDPYSMQTQARPQLNMPTINLFCVGQAHDSTGRLVTAGGHISVDSIHDPQANRIHVYDANSGLWYRSPATLRHHRWYPTVTELPDGRMLVTSGSSQALVGSQVDFLPIVGYYAHLENSYEIYDPQADLMVDVGGSPSLIDRSNEPPERPLATYPAVFVLPGTPNSSQGVIFLQEANRGWLLEYHPESVPPLTHRAKYYMPATGSRSYPHYGAAVLLPFADGATIMKILVVGGQDESVQDHRIYDDFQIATRSAVIFTYDSSSPLNSQPGWSRTSTMSNPRLLCDATLLPNGEVLITGGISAGWSNQSYVRFAVRTAEIFDPSSGAFRIAAAQQFDRRYHSTAVLRPDGAVLKMGSSGGFAEGVGLDGVPWIRSHTEIEIYYPSYAWRSPRPVVKVRGGGMPYGTVETADVIGFNVQTAKVILIRAGAVTHGLDMDQRHITLSVVGRSPVIHAAAGRSRITLSFKSPTNATYAPPGFYLLFIVDGNGVPSVGQWVQVGAPAREFDALFVSQDIPSTLVLGEVRPAAVVMRNTGTTTWSLETTIALGSSDPPYNNRWGVQMVDVPGEVGPGEDATFNFLVHALHAGRLNAQWRMAIKANFEQFGESTPSIQITVTQAAGPTVVPDVVGQKRTQARQTITASDLIARFINMRPIGNPNMAHVVTQDPPAGTEVARQSEVVLSLDI